MSMTEFQAGRLVNQLEEINKQLSRLADAAEEISEATKIGGPLDLRNLVQRGEVDDQPPYDRPHIRR